MADTANKFINKDPDSNWDMYFDGTYWLTDREVCHHCLDERAAASKTFVANEERYSFGVYAGRYCDACWKESGYRDAADPDAEFSELDAGESLYGEDDAWS